MIGGNLTELDIWTTSLLTNPEILAVDQHSFNGRQVPRAGNATEDATGNIIVWRAQASDGDGEYLAVFNRTETSQAIEYRWRDLGLEGDSYNLRDLWEHKNLGRTQVLKTQLPGHGVILYRVWLK